jgi:hypothetical protein
MPWFNNRKEGVDREGRWKLEGGKKIRVDRLSSLEGLMSINMSGFVETLELRYLSKGRSEFGKNDIFRKV